MAEPEAEAPVADDAAPPAADAEAAPPAEPSSEAAAAPVDDAEVPEEGAAADDTADADEAAAVLDAAEVSVDDEAPPADAEPVVEVEAVEVVEAVEAVEEPAEEEELPAEAEEVVTTEETVAEVEAERRENAKAVAERRENAAAAAADDVEPAAEEELTAAEIEELSGADTEAAAVRIQAMQRGKADRKAVAERRGNATAAAADDVEPAAEAEVEEDLTAAEIEELSGVDTEAAAVRMQAMQRGKADRKAVAERRENAASAAGGAPAAEVEEQAVAAATAPEPEPEAGAQATDVAATKAKTRGALLSGLKSGALEAAVTKMEEDETAAEEDLTAAEIEELSGADTEAAAVRIQAMQRGKVDRKAVAERRENAASAAGGAPAAEVELTAAEIEELSGADTEAAATMIQKVYRGKAARRQGMPQIEDRLLGWSPDWYIAMQTIAGAMSSPFMQGRFKDLTAAETTFLKEKFEQVKQQRFEGGEAEFWKFVASSFCKADTDRSSMLDLSSFKGLCDAIFGSFGELQEATGEGMEDFFSRADADKSGKVSFAELVAVFVVEEQRSPVLRNWVMEQAAVKEREEDRADAVVAGEITSEQADAEAEREEEDKAARRIQSMQRGKLARREVGQMRADQQQEDIAPAAEEGLTAAEIEELSGADTEAAAVRIQAMQRGKAARKGQTDAQKRTADERAQVQRQVKNRMAVPSDHAALAGRLDGKLESLETDTWVAQQEEEMEREDAWRAEQEGAAVRIQAMQRGKQARRELDGGGLMVDVDGMEGMGESEMSLPAEPWPDGRSPIPQKSRLPLPAGGHTALPKPHSKVRFGGDSPTPVAPTGHRNTLPNGGRELQMRRGGGLAPLDDPGPDYDADSFVSALNTKRVKIEQQVAALQSRIIEQNLGGGDIDLEAKDGGAGILEEVKVFQALNAHMEQLVSLENEFLRAIDQQKKLLLARHMAASNPVLPPSVIKPLPGGQESYDDESENGYGGYDVGGTYGHSSHRSQNRREEKRSMSNSPHGYSSRRQGGSDMPMGESRTGQARHGRKAKGRDIAARTAERAAELDAQRGGNANNNERGTLAPPLLSTAVV